MNYNLSALELRTISLLDNTLSIKELTKRTGITKGYISRTVASLKDKVSWKFNFKEGVTKKAALSSNLHAVRLKSLLYNRRYMPLEELLQGSSMQILAVLSHDTSDFDRLIEEGGNPLAVD